MNRIAWLLGFLSFVSGLAIGEVKVITTLPDLAWAVSEVGGEKVNVQSLLKGLEDPHHVDTIPEFIRLTANADLVVLVGMELEEGWMPKVISRSGNSRVQRGSPGYFEAGSAITVLEKPVGPVDRSMGDVHPGGNPHFWLSPLSLSEAAVGIEQALTRVDPAHRKDYETGRKAFQAKLKTIFEKNRARLQGKKLAVMEYHREFSYFFSAYGLKSLGSIEEKPGVTPPAGRLAEVASLARAAEVKVAIAGPYAPKKTLDRFSEVSGVPVKVVPTSLSPGTATATYEAVQTAIVDAILGGNEK